MARLAYDTVREMMAAVVELEHEKRLALVLFEPVDGRDVRVVERRQHLSFAAKPSESLGHPGHIGREYLDGELAAELGVARTEDVAHPAFADGLDDFVRSETISHGRCGR